MTIQATPMPSKLPTTISPMPTRWLTLAILLLLAFTARAQDPAPKLIAPGVWFLPGDAHKGDSNTIVIEMQDTLLVVDGSYPGRAKELLQIIPTLSPKPIRYVFSTHAHGDHSYGNSVWNHAGIATLAAEGVDEEMDRYEPARWQAALAKRDDVRALNEPFPARPTHVFRGRKMVIKDGAREVDFLFLGWAHTRGDGFVWLPRERILCTGDAAVNGPRNKLWDADIANWPRVLDEAAKLRPVHVLPGHGPDGGAEILSAQARFLRDLLAAVHDQVSAGKTLEQAQTEVHLPAADANWIPADMSGDIEAAFREVKEGKPMGALPHTWR